MSSPIPPGRMYEYRSGGTKPPDARGIYRIRQSDGKIMYIGISEHLRKRMNDHIGTGNFRPNEGEYFQYQVAKSDAEYDQMRDLERAWINKYDPPRNKRGGGGRPPQSHALGGSHHSGGGCYITTAVCESSGKPDDCYELTMFRSFRDNWLIYQEDGPALIADYYATAPEIVNKINQRLDCHEVYQRLEKNYVRECLDAIERGDNEFCKKTYIRMMRCLQIEYLAPNGTETRGKLSS